VKATNARSLRRLGAIAGVVALASLSAAPALGADSGSGSVEVVNTETVQVYMSADGDIQSKRVYEQLALSGHGSVDLKNPVATDGLRNLDGFGGFEVKDGDQIAKTTVDGTKHYRSVSNFTGTLPVSITTEYTLDGKKVAPGDVVGKSGKLEVKFVVTNKTSVPQEVTIDDGSGGTVTKTVDVPVPMVGSLTTTAPASFTNVQTGGANTAGDGTGGTKISYTMTLFPPLGSSTATLGYTADITDGIVPRVEVALLPVDPLSSPTFKSAGESYQGGADTGAQLVEGAGTIDSNLLKLRDGAADLLAGLIKLSDGADQLSAGLTNEAAPGSAKLADGTGDALAGAKDLKDGHGQISGGLDQLADQLPAAGPGIQQLIDGVDKIIAGFGAVGQTGTLIDGLTKLNAGALQLKAGLTGQVVPGITQSKGGVDQVRAGLNDAIKAGGSIDQLIQGLSAVAGNLLPGMDCGPVCQATINGGILPGVQGSKTDLTAAYAGLGLVSGGLQQVLTGLSAQIVPGLDALAAGADAAKSGAQQLKSGNQQVRDGLAELKAKLGAAIAGVLKLDAGAGEAYAGSGDLADGLGQIDDGANDLADGLGDAADGSGQIADGLRTASGGAPQLVDGAGRLSKEGMGELIKAGKETAVNYGELYAVIKAGSERAQTSSMANGAPAGAEGLTAYSFTITEENGEGTRNVTRGVGALALAGLGAGVFLMRRRLV
jgi:putative membrane protein